MNTYKCLVKLTVTKTMTTTTNVVVQATDAHKAKLQLDVLYGKSNVVTYPILVKWLQKLLNDGIFDGIWLMLQKHIPLLHI